MRSCNTPGCAGFGRHKVTTWETLDGILIGTDRFYCNQCVPAKRKDTRCANTSFSAVASVGDVACAGGHGRNNLRANALVFGVTSGEMLLPD
jgi:hypothetical protein